MWMHVYADTKFDNHGNVYIYAFCCFYMSSIVYAGPFLVHLLSGLNNTKMGSFWREES